MLFVRVSLQELTSCYLGNFNYVSVTLNAHSNSLVLRIRFDSTLNQESTNMRNKQKKLTDCFGKKKKKKDNIEC